MQKLKIEASSSTTKQKGDAAEDRALQHLQAQGLQLVQRNYRTPGRGGGEIDLILRDADGNLTDDMIWPVVQKLAKLLVWSHFEKLNEYDGVAGFTKAQGED